MFIHLTWHQVVRKDIPFGAGSTSEHLNLKADYVQDTFQVSNAMPFGVESILGMKALTASNLPLCAISINGEQLVLQFEGTGVLAFTIEDPGADYFFMVCGDGDGCHVRGHDMRVADYRGECIMISRAQS